MTPRLTNKPILPLMAATLTPEEEAAGECPAEASRRGTGGFPPKEKLKV